MRCGRRIANSAVVRSKRILLALAVAVSGVLSACSGDIGSALRGGDGDPASPGAAAAPSNSTHPFDLAVDAPQLLPFTVRLARVAAVLGTDIDAPALETLRKNRTGLGDHDFANGQQPDRLWSASRMSLWIRSLKPVCASQAMRDRYPALPEDLGALIQAAYGRAMTADDRAAIDEVLGTATLDPATRYQLVCLAVLSSAELVVQ